MILRFFYVLLPPRYNRVYTMKRLTTFLLLLAGTLPAIYTQEARHLLPVLERLSEGILKAEVVPEANNFRHNLNKTSRPLA